MKHSCPTRAGSGRDHILQTTAHRRFRLFAAGLALLVFLAGDLLGARAQSTGTSEYEVKAAFLYNFAKFVDWPPDAFPGARPPFQLCILGADPFGGSLDHAVAGKTVNSRSVSIHRSNRVQELSGCELVFVSSSEKDRVTEILDALHGASVLTVGETDGFAELGGAVQFIIEDYRVHFAINVDALERGRLRASSKLLALAHIVHDKRQRKKG